MGILTTFIDDVKRRMFGLVQKTASEPTVCSPKENPTSWRRMDVTDDLFCQSDKIATQYSGRAVILTWHSCVAGSSRESRCTRISWTSRESLRTSWSWWAWTSRETIRSWNVRVFSGEYLTKGWMNWLVKVAEIRLGLTSDSWLYWIDAVSG